MIVLGLLCNNQGFPSIVLFFTPFYCYLCLLDMDYRKYCEITAVVILLAEFDTDRVI